MKPAIATFTRSGNPGRKVLKGKLRYHFYMLRCKDRTIYCGITNDLARRLAMHNSGKGSAYVRSRGGGKIIYSEPCKTLSAALRREFEVKKWTRAKKLALARKHILSN